MNVVDVKVIEKARLSEENLENAVMRLLRECPKGSCEIFCEIFQRYGVAVNRSRLERLLESLEQRGRVRREKLGLVTAFSLQSEEGKPHPELIPALSTKESMLPARC